MIHKTRLSEITLESGISYLGERVLRGTLQQGNVLSPSAQAAPPKVLKHLLNPELTWDRSIEQPPIGLDFSAMRASGNGVMIKQPISQLTVTCTHTIPVCKKFNWYNERPPSRIKILTS